MSPRGFAPPCPAPRTVAVWFSCYGQGDEDEPLSVTRETLPAAHGQDIARLAVLHARRLLVEWPAVFEVIAHRGHQSEPQRGDDVIARVCREAFRGSRRL